MRKTIQLSIGGLLIIFGILLLLQMFNIIPTTVNLVIWAVLLIASGGFFLYIFRQNQRQWWWLIPGVSLIGIGISNIIEILFPEFSNIYIDLLVLGSIGLSFLTVYLFNRKQWWGIIPSGVLLTLGVVSSLENSNSLPSGFDTDGIFFIGLGLTFMIIYFLPTAFGNMRWAIYPGASLLLIGTYLTADNDILFWQIAGPLLLIIFGGYFLVRSWKN